MPSFTRREMEDAFSRYQEVAARAASSGNWRPWADMFTEDATYIEHHFGEFKGREAIFRWISETMATPPNDRMTSFPIAWYVIDEARGWVVCEIDNVMDDPGDGSDHRAVNWTLLKYAGDDQWSYEEDVYNPLEFGKMLEGWSAAKGAS